MYAINLLFFSISLIGQALYSILTQRSMNVEKEYELQNQVFLESWTEAFGATFVLTLIYK